MLLTTPAPHLIRRNFLSAEDHAALLAYALENQAEFMPSMIYTGVNENIRRSLSYDPGPFKSIFKAAVRQQYKQWIAELRTTDFELAKSELEMVAHGDGAHFFFHIDTMTGASGAELPTLRVLSAVYYFYREPKAFTGGQLLLYPLGSNGKGEQFATIEPEQNTMVVFPSWAPHQVVPIRCPSKEFADSRFAVNYWLHMDKKKPQ